MSASLPWPLPAPLLRTWLLNFMQQLERKCGCAPGRLRLPAFAVIHSLVVAHVGDAADHDPAHTRRVVDRCQEPGALGLVSDSPRRGLRDQLRSLRLA